MTSTKHQSARIVTLVPSATEIVCALGFEQELVGRSHECDYPLTVKQLPACTSPHFDGTGSSLEIDTQIKTLVQKALSIYHVEDEILIPLQPTVIITQHQCDVCAISFEEVEKAISEKFTHPIEMISLSAQNLEEVWADILRVGKGLNVQAKAERLIQKLQQQLSDIKTQGEKLLKAPKVLCIEWIEPLMAAGNWMPNLIQLAGGIPCAGEPGKHSPWITWETILQENPDVIIVIPCGFSIDRTLSEIHLLTENPHWKTLKAVQLNQVYLADGNQYFNRPGPRLVDSAQILLEIFQDVETFSQAPSTLENQFMIRSETTDRWKKL
ncbi:MAG: cobalamin-binding protein [Cyanobacteria bacterium]|nr:cobalamin-binding protein [Cyanobacteriota bacterium]